MRRPVGSMVAVLGLLSSTRGSPFAQSLKTAQEDPRPDRALSSPVPQKFDEEERPKLERLFRIALAYLAVLIGASLMLSIYFLRQSPPDLLLVALFTGVIGSATAAFVSALDRHAQGLEDRYGGATPKPDAKKERFSERMFYWFLGRPWLGAVVGVAVFWGR
ncbi:MAG TPA: hypothetical protein VLQ45_34150, partial [Thermoanaerobaculia bacterium]|nr:hypothetical protein [Thermoanaerobaculia bacterium]